MSDDLELAGKLRLIPLMSVPIVLQVMLESAADAIERLTAEVAQDRIDLEEYRRDVERLTAENKQLRAENERLLIDGIHTCHDQCQRVACVLRRERDAALADVERLRAALTPTISPWTGRSFYRDDKRYWLGDGLPAEMQQGAVKAVGEDKE